MNREIKFEYGFSSVNGIVKKHYHLHELPNIKQLCDVWDVLPIAYVRQYTGLKDKNVKEIYEGDILSGIIEVNYDERRTKHGNYATKKPFNAVTRVIFLEAEAKFVTYSNQKNSYYSGFWAGSGRTRQEKQNNQWRELTERVTVPISKLIEFEVIGNIYENPELLNP